MSALGFCYIWQLNVGEHTDQDMAEIIGNFTILIAA